MIKRRVLVVDDEPSMLELLTELLTALGQQARGVPPADARAALAAGPWDVLLVDLALPPNDGTELIAWAKARWPGLRCVLYSAQPDTAAIARLAQTVGADAWLPKPFDLAALAVAVGGEG